jgi:antitoxin component YwqK of YwqJK toxin-antitoxin module
MNTEDDIIKRKATARDWDKVRALYIRGEALDDICKALPNVNLTTKNILKRMALEGVTAKKKALNDRIVDNMLNITEEEKIKTNNDCIRLFNSGAKVIESLLEKYTDELETGKVDRHAKATAYNVDMLMSGVTKIQKGLRVAYGMDDNGKLFEKEPEVLVIEGINTDKI